MLLTYNTKIQDFFELKNYERKILDFFLYYHIQLYKNEDPKITS